MIGYRYWIAALACCGAWTSWGGQARSQSEVEKGSPVVKLKGNLPVYRYSEQENGSRLENERSSAGEEGRIVGDQVRRIVVSTDRQAGKTKAEAEAILENVLDEQRAKQVCQLARDCARIQLTPAEGRREWYWLVQQAGVQERVTRDLSEPREYGWVAQRDVEIVFPAQVLANWTNRLQARLVHRRQRLLMAAAGSLVGLILALAVAVVLDRKTGGYYRAVIVVGVLVTLALLGAALWVGLVGKAV